MAEFNIVEERALSLPEVKERLTAKEKEEKLNFRAEKTKAYVENVLQNGKTPEKLRTDIMALNIPRLRDRHIVKIIDIMPMDRDSLKVLFSGDAITLTEDDIEKIINVINH